MMKRDFFNRLADLLEDLLNRSTDLDNEISDEMLDRVFSNVIYELYNTVNLTHAQRLRNEIINNPYMNRTLDDELLSDITRVRALFASVIRNLLVDIIGDGLPNDIQIESVLDVLIAEFYLSYTLSRPSYQLITPSRWAELNSRDSSTNNTTYTGYKLLEYCFGDSSSLEILNILWDQLMQDKALENSNSSVYNSAKEVYGDFDVDVASFVEALLGEESVSLLNKYAKMIFGEESIDNVAIGRSALAMLGATKTDEGEYSISSRSLKTIMVILPAFMSTLKSNLELTSLKPVVSVLQAEKERIEKSAIQETDRIRLQLDELSGQLLKEKQKINRLRNRNTDLETFKDARSTLMNALDALEREKEELTRSLKFKEDILKHTSDELLKLKETMSENFREFVFSRPVFVNYFGAEKELNTALLRYNVIVEIYSPFEPPSSTNLKRSDVTILNTQRASHAVYYWLKSRINDLVLVNNSNPYLIKSEICRVMGIS